MKILAFIFGLFLLAIPQAAKADYVCSPIPLVSVADRSIQAPSGVLYNLNGGGCAIVNQTSDVSWFLSQGFTDLTTVLGQVSTSIIPCDAANSYLFVADYVTDNTGAFNRWFNNLNGNSGCIGFSASSSSYRFNSQVNIPLAPNQNVTINGQGAASTLLSAGAHDLFHVTYQPHIAGPNPGAGVFSLQGLRLTTDQALAQTAVYIDGNSHSGMQTPATLLSNNTFEGSTATASWAKSMYFHDLTNVIVENATINAVCLASGCADYGIYYEGIDGNHPTDLHVHHLEMVRGGYGVYATGDFEGVTVDGQSNFTAQNYPIYCNGDTFAGSGICSVTNNFINGNNVSISIYGMANISISANQIYQGARSWMAANAPMILISGNGTNSGLTTSIVGNTLQGFTKGPTQPVGISLLQASGVSITGNVFSNLGPAFTSDATTSNVSGSGNRLYGTTTAPVDSSVGTFNKVTFDLVNTEWHESNGNNLLQLDHPAAPVGATSEFVNRIISSVAGNITQWTFDLSDGTLISGPLIGPNVVFKRFFNSGNLADIPLLIRKETGSVELANSLFLGGLSSTGNQYAGSIAFPVGSPGCPPATTGVFYICQDANGLEAINSAGTAIPLALGGTGTGKGQVAAANISTPYVVCQGSPATAITGTTAETNAAVCRIPAGALPSGANLRIEEFWTFTGTAGIKTALTRFSTSSGATSGSSYLNYANLATNTNEVCAFTLWSQGTSAQIGRQSTLCQDGAGAAANISSTVNTASASYINFNITNASAADTSTLQSYRVELYPSAGN